MKCHSLTAKIGKKEKKVLWDWLQGSISPKQSEAQCLAQLD